MDRQSQELMPLTALQHSYPADVDIANPRGGFLMANGIKGQIPF